jgi:hypothetical protein
MHAFIDRVNLLSQLGKRRRRGRRLRHLMKPGEFSILILRSREAASRRMQARSPPWFETAQERLLTMRVHRRPVNPVTGLTKSRQGTKFAAFRGHLSRPACSHVKKIAKQAGDTSDPGRTQFQAGFFIGLIHIVVRERSAKAAETKW